MKKEKKHILILSSWSYSDPLVHSYILPYLRIIRKLISDDRLIYLQTFEKKTYNHHEEEFLKINGELNVLGIQWKPIRYVSFGTRAILLFMAHIFRLTLFVWRKKIDVLHSFAPSAGNTGLFLKFFTRCKLIIDSWEPHAECMVQTGVWKSNSFAFRILWWSEKAQVKNAFKLIAASPGMIKYAEVSYGIKVDHVLFRPACVNLDVFNPSNFDRNAIRKKLNFEKKIVCACVSKLGGLYLREDAIRFFRAGSIVFGDSFHVLLLSSNTSEEINELCRSIGFDQNNLTHTHVPHHEVPGYMSACDFAFNPQKPVPAKRFGTPVKDGEYWAMGLPLIILPEISDDSAIIRNENGGVILEDLQDESMIDALQKMKSLLTSGMQLSASIRQIAIKHRSYEIAEKVYKTIYGKSKP